MHDIDRVQLETPEFEQEHEHGGGGYEFEYEGEYEGESAEYEGEYEGEFEGEYEGELGEAAELELASQFLEISTEQELEQFVGDVLRSAAGGVRDFARSKTGRALGGILKQAARRALPVVGQGIGERLGGPAAGSSVAPPATSPPAASGWSSRASATRTRSSRLPASSCASPERPATRPDRR